jgi:Nucleoside diphosphate kinase
MEWVALTRIPLKAQLYERETYFREGLNNALEVLGDDAFTLIRRAALVLIKPDGLVSGKASTITGFLRAHGFSIVAVEMPVLNRFHWRELWRYQLTCATPDRLAVNDLVLRDRALLLMLRDPGGLRVPATVHLSGLKGPSDIASQSADCLRRLLAQPNRIFSFFHVADEPADLVRELAVLFEAPVRRRLLSALRRDTLADTDRAILEEALSASDRNARELSAEASLRRAEEALRDIDHGEPSVAAALEHARRDFERMRRGERICWRDLAKALAATGVRLDAWDLATIAASYIVYDEPGTAKQIKGVDRDLWLREPGEI